jgi:hypothetical protein
LTSFISRPSSTYNARALAKQAEERLAEARQTIAETYGVEQRDPGVPS